MVGIIFGNIVKIRIPMNRIQPVQPILYNQSFYNRNNTSPSECQVKNKNKVINKMCFLYTSDLLTKDYLEKNGYRFVQEQVMENEKIYVFENKLNQKFSKDLNLQISYSNKLRF